MVGGVMIIQRASQNMLKGKPRITGSIRSQSGTAKQMAMNGINPTRMDPKQGFFTKTSRLGAELFVYLPQLRLCQANTADPGQALPSDLAGTRAACLQSAYKE